MIIGGTYVSRVTSNGLWKSICATPSTYSVLKISIEDAQPALPSSDAGSYALLSPYISDLKKKKNVNVKYLQKKKKHIWTHSLWFFLNLKMGAINNWLIKMPFRRLIFSKMPNCNDCQKNLACLHKTSARKMSHKAGAQH